MYSTIFVLVLLVFGARASPAPKKFGLSTKDIFKGIPALKLGHPHMAGLTCDSRHRLLFCGGSILTSKTILTAAHCVDYVYINELLDNSLLVVVGSINWKVGTSRYCVSHNVTHPNYMPGPLKNDIAILITTTEIKFNIFTKPIELDYSPQNKGVRAKVAGWGRTEKGLSRHLMELSVDIVSGDECITNISKTSEIADLKVHDVDPLVEICASPPAAGHGTCVADSGGPLVRVDNGKQIGIVSWGLPCARGAPDVFVRIDPYKSWLEEVIVNK